MVLRVSISCNGLVRERGRWQATVRLASSKTNKQSLSSSQCSSHIFFSLLLLKSESETNNGRRLWAKGGEARATKPMQTSTISQINSQWGKGSSWIIWKCFHRSLHDSCQANKGPTRKFHRHLWDSCFHSSLGWLAGLCKNNRMDSDRTL